VRGERRASVLDQPLERFGQCGHADRAEIGRGALDRVRQRETAFSIRVTERPLQRRDAAADVVQENLGELEGHGGSGLARELLDPTRIEPLGVVDRSARIEARDRGRALGLACASDPIRDALAQRAQLERLGDHVVHAGCATRLAQAVDPRGRDGNHRNPIPLALEPPNFPSRLEAIDAREVAIHEHDVVNGRGELLHGVHPGHRRIDAAAHRCERALEERAGEIVVFDDEHAAALAAHGIGGQAVAVHRHRLPAKHPGEHLRARQRPLSEPPLLDVEVGLEQQLEGAHDGRERGDEIAPVSVDVSIARFRHATS